MPCATPDLIFALRIEDPEGLSACHGMGRASKVFRLTMQALLGNGVHYRRYLMHMNDMIKIHDGIS